MPEWLPGGCNGMGNRAKGVLRWEGGDPTGKKHRRSDLNSTLLGFEREEAAAVDLGFAR